jgi:dihydroorotase-like cyclic amidohydrolase
MSDEIEIGPIDYLVIEMPEANADGSGLLALVDLVDRGLIRIYDLAIIRKGADGVVDALALTDLGDSVAVFEGVSTGILGDDDLQEAAVALEPGTIGAVMVCENSWAAPFATALRRNGAQVVAQGRVPMNELLAAVED